MSRVCQRLRSNEPRRVRVPELLSQKTRISQLQTSLRILSHVLQQVNVVRMASTWIFSLVYSLFRSYTVVFAKLCNLLSFLRYEYAFYGKIIT